MRIASFYVSRRAQVAELVDALVSGTSGASRGGSSPLLGTIKAVRHPGCAQAGRRATIRERADTNKATDFMTRSQLASRRLRAERES